jgi:hypothetical protein
MTQSEKAQGQMLEAAREQKAETLQDRIEVNKLDIVLPHGELHGATQKQDSKGWKATQEKNSAGLAGRSRTGRAATGIPGMTRKHRRLLGPRRLGTVDHAHF